GRRLPGGRQPCSSQQDVEVDQRCVGAAVTVGDAVLDLVLAGEAGLGPVDRGAGAGVPVDRSALGGLAGDRLDAQAAVGTLVVVQQVAAVEPQLLAGLGVPAVVLGDHRIAAAAGRRSRR